MERLAWIIVGVLVTIVLQNFINDPIKNWRAKRSKRYGKRRVDSLKKELELVQDMASRQGETALRYLKASHEILWLFFYMLEIIAGAATFCFLVLFFPIARGEETLDVVFVIIGAFVCLMLFFLFDNFRSQSKAACSRIDSVLNFERFQRAVKETVNEIEESIAK